MSQRAKASKIKSSDPLGGTVVTPTVQSGLHDQIGKGSPLAADVAASFGHHMGADFSGVRVHTGPQADALTRGVAATAFTAGSDVFFRQGTYAPGTSGGDHLLAHELTHVVQGQSGPSRAASGETSVGKADAPEEAHAERNAAQVVSALRRSAAASVRSESIDLDHGNHPGMDHTQCDHLGALRRSASSARTLHRVGEAVAQPEALAGPEVVGPEVDGPEVDGPEVDGPVVGRPRRKRGQAVFAEHRLSGFKTSMADPARQLLEDNIPSSGLGKFDAHYDPEAGLMTITVRPRFTFTGTWTDIEQVGFIADFKTQIKAKWSAKHEFACRLPGMESLRAAVAVEVVPALPDERAHFECSVASEKPGPTYIGREQYNDPTKLAQGVFGKNDAKERAHDTVGTRCKMARHDEGRISMFLKENLTVDTRGRGVIRFAGDVMNSEDKVKLEQLVAILIKTKDLGASPFPLIVTRRDNGFFDSGKTRANLVQKMLAANGHYPVRVETASTQLEAQKATHKDAKYGGPRSRKEAADEISLRQGELKSTNVTIHPDEKFADTYTAADPYSILAHEFGHMLGNPDEYFGYGPGLFALKKADLEASGDRGDAQVAKSLKSDPKMEPAKAKMQQRWGEVVGEAGQKIPTMSVGTATHSIMSAGTVVLPAHYATIWEALGRITSRAVPGVPANAWTYSG